MGFLDSIKNYTGDLFGGQSDPGSDMNWVLPLGEKQQDWAQQAFGPGSDSSGWRTKPETAEQQYLSNYLTNLATQDINVPTRQVAGLSPDEQRQIELVNRYLAQGEQGQNLAMGELAKTLSASGDVRDSASYQGAKSESERLKAQSAADIKRQSQKSGMLKSYPAGRIMAEDSAMRDSMLLKELGRLEMADKDRRLNAAGMMGEVSGQGIRNVANASAVTSQARLIQQEQMNAENEALLMELLVPYQYQSPIASTLLKYEGDRQYFKQDNSAPWYQMLGTGIGSAVGGMYGGGQGAMLGGGIGNAMGSGVDQSQNPQTQYYF